MSWNYDTHDLNGAIDFVKMIVETNTKMYGFNEFILDDVAKGWSGGINISLKYSMGMVVVEWVGTRHEYDKKRF